MFLIKSKRRAGIPLTRARHTPDSVRKHQKQVISTTLISGAGSELHHQVLMVGSGNICQLRLGGSTHMVVVHRTAIVRVSM